MRSYCFEMRFRGWLAVESLFGHKEMSKLFRFRLLQILKDFLTFGAYDFYSLEKSLVPSIRLRYFMLTGLISMLKNWADVVLSGFPKLSSTSGAIDSLDLIAVAVRFELRRFGNILLVVITFDFYLSCFSCCAFTFKATRGLGLAQEHRSPMGSCSRPIRFCASNLYLSRRAVCFNFSVAYDPKFW